MSKGKWRPRFKWTREQLTLMSDLILKAEREGIRRFDWKPHMEALGHPYHAVIAQSVKMRQQMRHAEQAAAYAARIARQTPPVAKSIGIESHRISTPTQRLRFAADMIARVGTQGVTAGLLGDPPPGQSALDKMRAGTIERRPRRQGDPLPPRNITLATRPVRF